MSIITDLISQGYGGYQGWNDEAAVAADFKATGGSGKFTGTPGSGPIISQKPTYTQPAVNIAQKEAELAAMLQQGKTEAVNTLQSGKAPLKEKYDAVLASIKGAYDLTKSQAQTATAQEFGKRGIPLTSGVYGQAQTQATLPVDTAYAQ